MNDRIFIRGLEVSSNIGVPEEERAVPQRLEIDLEMAADFRGLDDDLGRSTDYAAVADWVRHECSLRSFRLLETLAEHLAAGLLKTFPRIGSVELEIRKFILPATKHVAVRLRRERH